MGRHRHRQPAPAKFFFEIFFFPFFLVGYQNFFFWSCGSTRGTGAARRHTWWGPEGPHRVQHSSGGPKGPIVYSTAAGAQRAPSCTPPAHRPFFVSFILI